MSTLKYLFWAWRNRCIRNAIRITWWEWRNGPAKGPLDSLRSIGVEEKTIQKLKDDKKIPEVQ